MPDRLFVWDKLMASVPINETAARVTSNSHEMAPEGPKLDTTFSHWKAPPCVQPVHLSQPNMAGERFGRFTVVGYLGKLTKSAKGRWLVRCQCGDYEARTQRAIENPANYDDMCYVCRDEAFLKQRSSSVRR